MRIEPLNALWMTNDEPDASNAAGARGSQPAPAAERQPASTIDEKGGCEKAFLYGGGIVGGVVGALGTRNSDGATKGVTIGSFVGGMLGLLVCPSDHENNGATHAVAEGSPDAGHPSQDSGPDRNNFEAASTKSSVETFSSSASNQADENEEEAVCR